MGVVGLVVVHSAHVLYGHLAAEFFPALAKKGLVDRFARFQGATWQPPPAAIISRLELLNLPLVVGDDGVNAQSVNIIKSHCATPN